MEQAGGRAVNGKDRLLTVPSEDIHQKSAFIAGSPFEVDWFQRIALGG
jgi:fructose-1,6-bisphosphatase